MNRASSNEKVRQTIAVLPTVPKKPPMRPGSIMIGRNAVTLVRTPKITGTKTA